MAIIDWSTFSPEEIQSYRKNVLKGVDGDMDAIHKAKAIAPSAAVDVNIIREYRERVQALRETEARLNAVDFAKLERNVAAKEAELKKAQSALTSARQALESSRELEFKIRDMKLTLRCVFEQAQSHQNHHQAADILKSELA